MKNIWCCGLHSSLNNSKTVSPQSWPNPRKPIFIRVYLLLNLLKPFDFLVLIFWTARTLVFFTIDFLSLFFPLSSDFNRQIFYAVFIRKRERDLTPIHFCGDGSAGSIHKLTQGTELYRFTLEISKLGELPGSRDETIFPYVSTQRRANANWTEGETSIKYFFGVERLVNSRVHLLLLSCCMSISLFISEGSWVLRMRGKWEKKRGNCGGSKFEKVSGACQLARVHKQLHRVSIKHEKRMNERENLPSVIWIVSKFTYVCYMNAENKELNDEWVSRVISLLSDHSHLCMRISSIFFIVSSPLKLKYIIEYHLSLVSLQNWQFIVLLQKILDHSKL